MDPQGSKAARGEENGKKIAGIWCNSFVSDFKQATHVYLIYMKRGSHTLTVLNKNKQYKNVILYNLGIS